jgi:regulator of protease activity HflC (stomatin/prohibitin superfamily)
MQWFGTITRYKKSSQFWFSAEEGQGDNNGPTIKARFNDGGHAQISGSVRFELPLDDVNLRRIHEKFHGQEAVEKQLIRTVMEKSIYLAGPLMSSTESSGSKRSDLLRYIEDQAVHGVYQTRAQCQTVTDNTSKLEKQVCNVEILADDKGGFKRQGPSPIDEFGIKLLNLSINGLAYTPDVEAQIGQQQKAKAQVEIAIAQAREAVQKTITAEEQGKAEAATAKWAQEKANATIVTEAEGKRRASELAMQGAEFYKKEQILRGDGDAAYKKAVMSADGALDAKLQAYVEVQKAYAAEIGKQRWVPEVQIGGGNGQGGGSNALNLIELMSIKAAKDLALDLQNKGGAPKK